MSKLDPSDLYNALRSEIAQRTNLQHTYATLNLVAAGTILSFALTRRDLAEAGQALLVVPLLASMLSAVWLHHAFSIIEIGEFLRDEYTDTWETKHAYGVFVGSLLGVPQLFNFAGSAGLSLIVYSSRPSDGSLFGALFWIDLILLTLSVIGFLILLARYMSLDWVTGKLVTRPTPTNESAQSGINEKP
jgi:hypothetical protein